MSHEQADGIAVRHDFTFEEERLPGPVSPLQLSSSPGSRMQRPNNDDTELIRLGKKPVLKRRFGFLSMLGFCCTVLASWETACSTFQTSLANGGPAGVIWGFLVLWIGTMSVFSTIAELASMAPTSGGQYHWAAMLAPRSCRKYLSYTTAWVTIVAWQANNATAYYLGSTFLQATIATFDPVYEPTAWQGVLICWAYLVAAVFINTVAAPTLPKLESFFLAFHILGFFGFLVPIVYFAPHGPAAEVFTNFLNIGGWSTQGVSVLVGLNGLVYALIGADSAVHMSEEITNASLVVPRAMVIGVVINGIMALAMLIAIMFCMGDLQMALNAEYPWIEVVVNALQFGPGATIIIVIAIVLGFFANVGVLTSASRQLWSFSRDRGVPGWQLVSKLERRISIPIYAVLISAVVAGVLSLISLGSTTVFNDLTSLTVIAYYASYLIACGLLLWRRLGGPIEPYDYSAAELGPGKLMWGKWKLPEAFGIANNVFACCFLVVITIFSLFPVSTMPDPSTMNYAIVVFGGVIFFSIIWYILVARHTYTGPVVEVQLGKIERA